MFSAWKPEAAAQITKPAKHGGTLLTRIMYDETPQTYSTFNDMRQLLQQTRGDLLTINAEEFASSLQPAGEHNAILDILHARNIPISMRAGAILEKTGLIGLAGTLKAIDTGAISPGSRVLCCLTSGVSHADGMARPEVILRTRGDVMQYAASTARKN
jgi:sirohydrochlorin ferrochelatase